MQYDETLTALDELEAAWHQQQTLVREIIALRQQLLGVAEGRCGGRCRTRMPWRIRRQSQSQNRIIPVPYTG